MLFGRIIEILDVNGNVLRIKYGVMRSEMFVVFLLVINEKDFFLRRIWLGIVFSILLCNSFCIVNGGIVFENNNM